MNIKLISMLCMIEQIEIMWMQGNNTMKVSYEKRNLPQHQFSNNYMFRYENIVNVECLKCLPIISYHNK